MSSGKRDSLLEQAVRHGIEILARELADLAHHDLPITADDQRKRQTGNAIAQALQVPVKFVGLGEGIDDLQPFDAQEYVGALI